MVSRMVINCSSVREPLECDLESTLDTARRRSERSSRLALELISNESASGKGGGGSLGLGWCNDEAGLGLEGWDRRVEVFGMVGSGGSIWEGVFGVGLLGWCG